MMDENDNGGIVSFKATSIEPGEDNETNAARLQRAPAMSMMDENDNGEIGGGGLPLECTFLCSFFCSFSFGALFCSGRIGKEEIREPHYDGRATRFGPFVWETFVKPAVAMIQLGRYAAG